MSKHYYTDGSVKKLFDDNDVPNGWYRGLPDAEKERLKSISNNRKGKHNSEASKQKQSESMCEYYQSHQHPMSGKQHSEDTKQKISESKSGKPSSRKGVKYTQEQIENRNSNIIYKYGSLENYYTLCTERNKQSKFLNHNNPNYNNREKASYTISSIDNFYENRNEKTKITRINKYGSLENYNNYYLNKLANNAGFNNVVDYASYWRNNILKNVNPKMSRLEKRTQELLISNKFNYKNRVLIKNDTLSHEFDFGIYNDSDQLICLIDCDGVYYHSYLTDVNGKSVNNYSDDYRTLLIPQNVKFICVVEGFEKEGFSEILKIINLDYDDYVKTIYDWCRQIDFPYPKYSDDILLNSYSALLKSDCDKFTTKARYGEKIINHFHRSIFSAHKKNKPSLLSAWNNDDLLLEAINNRIIYKGCSLDQSKILSGLSISGIAPKVSIFNPYLAKYIVNKYLNDFDTVFDPFSGYSGRLLGCASLNKRYIGQDINKIAVEESNQIIDFFNLSNISCVTNDSKITSGTYDCLFTCPPYSDKEIWEDTLDIHSCDEWIDICLKNYHCKTYIFVVDDTEKYKDNIVETIHNKSHFTDNYEYIIKINTIF